MSAAVTAGPKRTRQTYTRYQTLELEKVQIFTFFWYFKNQKMVF